ncbi:MAG: UDP-4-amino-4,6-dideoxy-N-acetyl-beta-L-altrosamine transaminase [Pseudomonadota bacterium]|jgi:UDP-4-amino-4,6-dideoxy-N-acetyl-beta-L-altrosamine transaminase
MIPYARQDIDEADIRAVVDVLNSDWLTQGPAIERFEAAVAGYCGARYAVAVCNATAALHLSCLAAGLKPGGLLWTSPNTFVASANCALYCGAKVDFVDIDAATYNLSVSALEKKLAQAEQHGSLPDVVIPVHFAGQSCEMEAVAQLARRHGVTVIEDASHAIGGGYQGGKIGDCRHSDMTVLSFHAVKIITSGEGGMILTNREDLYRKLLLLRSHGIVRDPARMVSEPDGPWYYQQIELGYNYRMTDIQAALGASQMNRLDEFVARRNDLARRYDEALSALPLRLPAVRPDCYSAYHLYVVQIDPARTKATRREVFDALRNAGIGANVHYIPVHTQPYYQRLGFRSGDFPEAEGYYSRAISLPLYYGLSEAEQDFVVATLKQALA